MLQDGQHPAPAHSHVAASCSAASTQPRTQISHHTLLNTTCSTSRVRQISREIPAVRSTAVKDFSILQPTVKTGFYEFSCMRA